MIIMIEKKRMRRSKKQIELEHSDDDIPDTSEVHQIKIDNEIKQKIDDDFLQRGYALMETMTQNYKDQREELRRLMKQYKHELRNAKKNTKQKKTTAQTGFTKPTIVPDDLAELVDLEKGSVMPRTELTKEIYRVFKDRGLHYENDKRVLRTDAQIRQVFNLDEAVNNSTEYNDPNGLNFFTLQKHIAKVYNDFETKQNAPAPKKKQNKQVKSSSS